VAMRNNHRFSATKWLYRRWPSPSFSPILPALLIPPPHDPPVQSHPRARPPTAPSPTTTSARPSLLLRPGPQRPPNPRGPPTPPRASVPPAPHAHGPKHRGQRQRNRRDGLRTLYIPLHTTTHLHATTPPPPGRGARPTGPHRVTAAPPQARRVAPPRPAHRPPAASTHAGRRPHAPRSLGGRAARHACPGTAASPTHDLRGDTRGVAT